MIIQQCDVCQKMIDDFDEEVISIRARRAFVGHELCLKCAEPIIKKYELLPKSGLKNLSKASKVV